MNLSDRSVCVIVAAYNAQDTIERAVSSALQQEHVREVVVVDDASQDQTSTRALSRDDGSGRLAIVTFAENRGPAAARNAALERSQSAYVCTLDADDYFLPDRISSLMRVGDLSWDMIADDILIAPEHLQHREFSIISAGPPRLSRALDLESFVRGNISRPDRPRGELGFLKPIIRRSFLYQHGLKYDERLRLGEDFALYTRSLLAGARFGIASTCGYVAIERNSSISALHSARDLALLAALDDEYLKNESGLGRTERAALASHRKATVRKYDYRRLLDRKKTHGWRAALTLVPTMPASVPYIAAETVRAKTSWLFEHRGDDVSLGFRFLLGIPEVQLQLSAAE